MRLDDRVQGSESPWSYERDDVRFIWPGGDTVLLYAPVYGTGTELWQLMDHVLVIEGSLPGVREFEDLIDTWVEHGGLHSTPLRTASAQQLTRF